MAVIYIYAAVTSAASVGTSHLTEPSVKNQWLSMGSFTWQLGQEGMGISIVIVISKVTAIEYPKELFALGFGLEIAKAMEMLMLIRVGTQYPVL